MNEPPTFLVPLVLLIPVGVIVAISRFSGWSLLAEHYPGYGDFPRPARWMGYGVFRGWLGYNGGIVVASNARGLYLRATPVILSFCHRRIFIPWSEIARIEQRSGWLGLVYAIRTRRATEVDFALRPSTVAVVLEDARRAAGPRHVRRAGRPVYVASSGCAPGLHHGSRTGWRWGQGMPCP